MIVHRLRDTGTAFLQPSPSPLAGLNGVVGQAQRLGIHVRLVPTGVHATRPTRPLVGEHTAEDELPEGVELLRPAEEGGSNEQMIVAKSLALVVENGCGAASPGDGQATSQGDERAGQRDGQAASSAPDTLVIAVLRLERTRLDLSSVQSALGSDAPVRMASRDELRERFGFVAGACQESLRIDRVPPPARSTTSHQTSVQIDRNAPPIHHISPDERSDRP